MLLSLFKSLTSTWNCLNRFQHCSLQADEIKSLTWLVRGGGGLAVRTTVPAGNAGAILSEQSQELRSLQAPSAFFNRPTTEIVPTTSQLNPPNAQYLPSRSDVPTESSFDYLTSSDGEIEDQALQHMLISHPDKAEPGDAVLYGMQMLDHLYSQIEEAEADLGHQLLSCTEPYHRLRSLKLHSHLARQSLEDVKRRVDKQELRRICESYHFEYTLQNERRHMVLHPDPEIKSKLNNAALIARAFIGDPAAIWRDILSIQTYAILMAQ